MNQWRHRIIFTMLVITGLTVSTSHDCFAAFAVQVGAFQSSERVAERERLIQGFGFPTILQKSSTSGKTPLTAVLVGPFEQSSEAEAARATLQQHEINGYVRFYHADAPSAQWAAGSPLERRNAHTGGSLLQRVAAATTAGPASAPDPQAKSSSGTSGLPFSVSGHFQTALAYTVAQPDHWSKIKNTLHLAVERALAADINLKVSGRFSYDGAYDVSNFFPERVRRDQRFDGMFHETYLDVGLTDWTFRLGRQHITWGEVVGLFFADVVSAKDVREFLVPEFDYIRIPQWAARAEYFKGDFKAEAVWIPYTTYDRIGKPGSDFYPFTIPPPPGFRQQIRSERTPHRLEHSSFGARASYLINGWDLGAFYYGSTDSNPTFFRSTVLAPTPTVRYRPDHERIHQAGMTMSKDTGSFVLKAEAVYTWDRYFNVTRPNDANGVVRQNFLDYIVSAEWPLPMESRLNLQFFQRWFTNHDRDIIPRRVENGATLFASTKLFNDKIEPELLTIHSLNRLDYMARFKVNWYFAKDWRFTVGTAYFGGKNLGLFGRFDQLDRVFTELRYTF